MTSNYLNKIITGQPSVARLLSAKEFRRYSSSVTTEMMLNGTLDRAAGATVYKVGNRIANENKADKIIYGDSETMFVKHVSKNKKEKTKTTKNKEREVRELLFVPEAFTPFEQFEGMIFRDDFLLADSIKIVMQGKARQYSNGGADFVTADYSGIVFRLAAGLCFYANYGFLEPELLSGDLTPNVELMSVATAPFTVGDNSVYMPRIVDKPYGSNVFGAIAYATTGAGGKVVTDILQLDDEGNLVVPSATGRDLAQGCYEALQMIGGMYQTSAAGANFALAVARGVTSVLTVVGMTDEGAYVRSVLRRGGYAVPHGPIDPNVSYYNGLQRPGTFTPQSVAAVMDSVAIGVAACVGISDPCVNRDGRTYPSVFTTEVLSVKDGIEMYDTAGHFSDINTRSGDFCKLYITALTRLFAFEAVSSGGSNMNSAVASLQLAFSDVKLKDDRHLKYETVSPFYWVEPSGVIAFSCDDFPIVEAGYGLLGKVGQVTKQPAFKKGRMLDQDGTVGEFAVEWLNARSNPILMHYANHVSDGLANYKIIGADPEMFAMTGGTTSPFEKMTAEVDLADYLWKRSDVSYHAPSECMYSGKIVTLLARYLTMDEKTWKYKPTRVPLGEELFNDINIIVSSLIPMSQGALGPDRSARRKYTRGVAALAEVRRACMSVHKSRLGIVKFAETTREAIVDPAAGQDRGFMTSHLATGQLSNKGAEEKIALRHQVVEQVPQTGVKLSKQQVDAMQTQVLDRAIPVEDEGSAVTEGAESI